MVYREGNHFGFHNAKTKQATVPTRLVGLKNYCESNGYQLHGQDLKFIDSCLNEFSPNEHDYVLREYIHVWKDAIYANKRRIEDPKKRANGWLLNTVAKEKLRRQYEHAHDTSDCQPEFETSHIHPPQI